MLPALIVGALTAWYLGVRLGVIVAVVTAVALLLANFLCRCHPERFVARASARAGIVTVIVAAGLQFLAITQAMLQEVTRECGDSFADCVGSPPWASLGPALVVGAAWLAVSLAMSVGAGRLGRHPSS